MTTTSLAHHHFDALLLALASSTDNFTVGLSIGLVVGGVRKKSKQSSNKTSSSSLPIWVNGTISICNAAGALFAGYGGMWLSQTMPSYLAPLLAALAFGILAIQEYRQSTQDDEENDNSTRQHSSLSSSSSFMTMPQVLQLAVPMTLNNLAGGVAGGAVGVAPLLSATYALVASFITMAVGHWVGRHLGKAFSSSSYNKRIPSLLSAGLLGILCVLTLNEAISSA